MHSGSLAPEAATSIGRAAAPLLADSVASCREGAATLLIGVLQVSCAVQSSLFRSLVVLSDPDGEQLLKRRRSVLQACAASAAELLPYVLPLVHSSLSVQSQVTSLEVDCSVLPSAQENEPCKLAQLLDNCADADM